MRLATVVQTFGLCVVAGPISGFLLSRAISAGVRRDYPVCLAWGAALGCFNILCFGAAAWILKGAL